MLERAVQEIIIAGRRLAAQGLVCAFAGNISCRLDAQTFLITASGVFKGAMLASDVLLVNDQGQALAAKSARQPSSELALHLAIYQGFSERTAIVHAHPPYATALACAGRELEWQILEEARLFLGPAPLLPRLSAGSKELALAAARAAKGVNALLLAGHGAISWGDSIEQALCRMETLEHTARVMLMRGLFECARADYV